MSVLSLVSVSLPVAGWLELLPVTKSVRPFGAPPHLRHTTDDCGARTLGGRAARALADPQQGPAVAQQ